MSLLKKMLSQCKKPDGRFGRFLARGMNFGHSGLTKWGLGFIDIANDIDALDIGCGGGRTVERLAGIATDGKVIGIDYSPDAVAVARKKNRVLINEKRVQIFQEAVSSMKFSDGAFDLITAFETHYFWPDFRNDLKEVYRVTKQNGQLLIVGAVYKNKKYGRRNQRIVDAIGMTYLGIDEFREVLEGIGYSEFDALEEKNKRWLAVKCKKITGKSGGR
ncbi:MAG: class I SAM-dependent methyltransferase [Desulfobacteraceae bacterium]|nr:class I SAM-dependent methyltransferase [Desulfobacteraceae bacterium]